MNKYFFILLLILTAYLIGCGTKTGSGYTGGPTGESNLSLRSSAFSTSYSAVKLNRIFDLLDSISTFKFCVKKVKIENESGEEVAKNGSTEIEMAVGLIDVSNGAAKTWGTPLFPTGFTMSRMKVIVEKDSELCGMSSSIQFNSVTTESGVEFLWDFNPDITVENTDTIVLSLSSVASTLNSAANLGNLNNGNLKNYVEQVTGTGSED